MQLFDDDTNALVPNKEEALKDFWRCLDTFWLASSSIINHAKTGSKSYTKIPQAGSWHKVAKLLMKGKWDSKSLSSRDVAMEASSTSGQTFIYSL